MPGTLSLVQITLYRQRVNLVASHHNLKSQTLVNLLSKLLVGLILALELQYSVAVLISLSGYERALGLHLVFGLKLLHHLCWQRLFAIHTTHVNNLARCKILIGNGHIHTAHVARIKLLVGKGVLHSRSRNILASVNLAIRCEVAIRILGLLAYVFNA